MEGTQPELSQLKYAQTDGNERVSLMRTFGGPSMLREVVETVLLAVVVLVVLSVTTGRFQVRGHSMEPSLHDGQYLIVTRVPYWIHPPDRGDVVVFRPPNGSSEDYVKRIVGLPGERIEIRGGRVLVNDGLIEEPYIPHPASYSGSWVLGEGEYFVLGDNRGNSSDSHSWGPLPGDSIVGKAWLRYWPPEDWGVVSHHVFPEPVDQGD